MTEILTRCGFRCDLCLAYKPNIEKHPENKQKLSDGWHKYFGFRIPPDEIYCEDCMAEEIPEEDYLCFIKPYENKKRFDALR
jgi:hypothetical protein